MNQLNRLNKNTRDLLSFARPAEPRFLPGNLREFKRNIKGVSIKARDLLIDYHWPGNVRELKNIVQRVIILESDEEILAEHLPGEIRTRQSITDHFQDIGIDFQNTG